MLTIFTTCKPFDGEAAVHQRNAIGSWVRLPDVGVILMGADAGTAEAAAEFGCRHISDVPVNEHGTPLVPGLFETAESESRSDVLAYVNADMVLLPDFVQAVQSIDRSRFLMVGRSWNAAIQEPVDLDAPGQPDLVERLARQGDELRDGLDYFVYTRGLYAGMPSLTVGRGYWDHWLIYAARAARAPVYDATAVTTVIHHAHGWGHVQGGRDEIWAGREIEENRALVGPHGSTFGNPDVTWRLTTDGARRVLNRRRLRRTLEFAAARRPWLKPLVSLALIGLHPGRLVGRAA